MDLDKFGTAQLIDQVQQRLQSILCCATTGWCNQHPLNTRNGPEKMGFRRMVQQQC